MSEQEDEDRWKCLDHTRTFLKKKLRVSSALLDYLFEKELITEDERDDIVKKLQTDKDKFDYLVKALKRNSRESFSDFLEGLRYSEQGHVANHLLRCRKSNHDDDAAVESTNDVQTQTSTDTVHAYSQSEALRTVRNALAFAVKKLVEKLVEYVLVFFICQFLLWYFGNLHVYVMPYKYS